MNTLLKQTQLSPTLAISAVNGDVSFSDMVKASDTVTFDQNKLVVLVFKKDSMINLKLSDFSKGTVIYKTATITPGNFDLNIHDVLSHITGDILFSNPSIKFILKPLDKNSVSHVSLKRFLNLRRCSNPRPTYES